MAITINSTSKSTGMPSAPFRAAELDVDLDASYPAGGYDVSAALPGAVVGPSPFVASHDGAALYWLHMVNDSGIPKLMVHDDDSGCPGAETSTADQSGHTGKKVLCFYQ